MDSSTQGNDNDETFQNDGSPQSPSRVLHISQLPSNATEADIISLGLPFGAVTNLLILKGRNQALLEMASEEAAVTMVNYYTPARPFLYNQPILIQFSNYRELNTDNLPNQARAQAALQIVKDVQSGNLATVSTPAAEGGPLPNQGSVLRIIVEDHNYPVTLDMLCQIFSRFGSILKIITFTKNNVFQALIQYADPVNAYSAKTALDGRSIYGTCCTMHIDFSKLASLKVKYNNEKSRDFTRLDLPSGDNQLTLEQHAAPACGSSGFVPPMGFAQAAGVPAPGVPLPDIPGAVSSFAVSTPGQTTLPGAFAGQGNTVLLVSNLNPEAITPYGLFILFGVYGDVHRVKIMFKRKENALIQMADAFQAQLAISYLNGLTLYGRVLRASLSKYQAVQLPYEGQQDQGLTKDFSNSPLHRFKWPGSKNFQNIFPPSATLHLCNIPPSVTPDHLKNLFASTGSTVKALKFFQRNCRMALIQLGSVEEAAQALIELHNHCFGESHYLRISFTKSTI